MLYGRDPYNLTSSDISKALVEVLTESYPEISKVIKKIVDDYH